jgi:hypothetical protein
MRDPLFVWAWTVRKIATLNEVERARSIPSRDRKRWNARTLDGLFLGLRVRDLVVIYRLAQKIRKPRADESLRAAFSTLSSENLIVLSVRPVEDLNG